MWWEGAVVYQVYPRSFQDSDGDGVGDLRGIAARLDHLRELGVDALWLSPIYPSPLADFGYDVSDYEAVDPAFGTLEGFDALVEAAHARGLRLLMDFVPCHTSIEHPWFREHPDWYIWARSDGGPPNNWVSAFGGSAWSPDPAGAPGLWYLHSFYPEQPDLDWRNPEVVAAMQGVLRFWFERGVDGFRVDAVDRILKDPELRDDGPAREPFGLPLREDEAAFDLRHSRNAPDTVRALAALRAAAGDALLVGEVYLPSARGDTYLEQLDAMFAFELLQSPWQAARLRAAIAGSAVLAGRRGPGAAWVMSNHDFGRLASRCGHENERLASMLLLTLPGMAFIYQGDEIGLADGPGAEPPFDRAGRDRYRHPMQWDGSRHGGFSDGAPWLPVVDAQERNVADQRRDPGSLLNFYHELIRLRRQLGGGFRLLDSDPGVIAYERGDHVVALNLAGEERRLGLRGEVVLATEASATLETLPAGAGVIAAGIG